MGGGTSLLHNPHVDQDKIAGVISRFMPGSDVEAIRQHMAENPALVDEELDELLLQIANSRLLEHHAKRMESHLAPSTPPPDAALEEGDHHDRAIVSQVSHRLMTSFSNHFVVAVDGSEVSHMAFMATMRLRRGEDHIEILHCYKRDQEGLPDSCKVMNIKERYETELVSTIPHRFFEVSMEPRLEGIEGPKMVAHYVNQQVTRDTLLAPDSVPNFLVMGVVGRKGPKEDPTILGKTAYDSLQFSHIPVILIRKPIPEDQPHLTYVMSVTSSDRSKSAFRLLLPLLRPRDKLIVIHITLDMVEYEALPSYTHPSSVQRHYEREIEEYAPLNSSFHLIEHVPGQPSHQTISDFMKQEEADFLVLAPRYRQALSSTTSHLIQKTRVNMVLFKG